MNSDIINIGTIPLTAVIATLFYILVKHFLDKDRSRQERFVDECKKFNAAFLDDIRRLQGGSEDACDILKTSFSKHEIAVLEFKQYLKGKKIRAFEEAWDDYCYGSFKGNKIPFIEQYFAAGNLNKKKKLILLALNRIEKLISFAKI